MKSLSNEELIEMAPAIGAESPASNVSNRYSFISSLESVEILRENGWAPVRVKTPASKSRDTSHIKHVIHFRRPEALETPDNQGVFEMIMINSHDRSARWSLMAGVYRLVCSNGLVVGTDFLQRLNVTHVNVDHKTIAESAHKMAEIAQDVVIRIDDMRNKPLNQHERDMFASRALAVRYPERKPVDFPVKNETLLRPNRRIDEGNDLWTVFNVIQENIMKGGQIDESVDRLGRYFLPTREVTSLDRSLGINQKLWNIAESYLN